MISVKGRHTPKSIDIQCVRWYCAYALSYQKIEEIMAEGDRVITISTFSGSFQKPLFGFPPNNKVIGFSAVSTWEIRRGRVCSQNTLVDLAGLQRQMAQDWGNGPVRAAG